MREMTPKGYMFLENEEGLRLSAYQDQGGIWTIGWGHTGPDVYAGLTISQAAAQDLFEKDTGWARACVEETCKPPPNDNEFDAMVSLCFNIGAANFKSSSVARLWNAGKIPEAADAFDLWNQSVINGRQQVNPVLKARRAREKAVFLTPIAAGVPVPTVMAQKVEPPAGVASSKTIWATAGGAAGATGIAASNVGPALDAINNAADTAEKAKTTFGRVGDLLAPLMNGHVYTVLILTVVVGLSIFGIVRLVQGIRAGRIKVGG